jgi:hypothetical protein
LTVDQFFRGTYHLYLQGQRTSQTETSVKAGGKKTLTYSLTLKIEVICSSKMSVNFQWTTWYYIPEDNSSILLTIEAVEQLLVKASITGF